MEVQKEAFVGLMEYYKLLPLHLKRSEIINELEEVISNYSKICSELGTVPNIMLNKEMLNVNRQDITEEEFLHALFSYVNALQDISGQFMDIVTNDVLLVRDKNVD